MRSPNLFMVGAPKCGTTALHNYLGQHPDVFMAPLKELFFLSDDFRMPASVFPSTLEEYLRCFKGAAHERYIGESTVTYMYSKTAARNIKDFCPEARIIMMLRNPADALQSLHNQLIFNGVETIDDFEAALAAAPRRIAEGRTEVGQNRFLRYQEIFLYSEQIRRYQDLFPPEQVHTIVYDDFNQGAEEVYRQVLMFLEIDPSFEPDLRVINARKRARSKRVRNILTDPPTWVSKLARPLLSSERRAQISSAVSSLNRKTITPSEMNAATRAALNEEFRPDVARVGRLIGRDLSHWTA
jgi:transposase